MRPRRHHRARPHRRHRQPPALVRRHCPERTVILSTDDPAAEAHLRAIPGVDAVVRRERNTRFTGRGADLVTSVIHCVSDHSIRVTDFRTFCPTLEDVFLKLTGHSIRD